MVRLRVVMIVVAVVAVASYSGWWIGRARASETMVGRVVRVVDGDTVDISLDGAVESVRLLGVNTPETTHRLANGSVVGQLECYGEEASAFTRARLLGRTISLELDREHRDRYSRLLAYITIDGQRFNDELLSGGYARLLVIPPNGSYARAMLGEEMKARQAGRGLWGHC